MQKASHCYGLSIILCLGWLIPCVRAVAFSADIYVYNGNVAVSPNSITPGTQFRIDYYSCNGGNASAPASSTRIQIKDNNLNLVPGADWTVTDPAVSVGNCAANAWLITPPANMAAGTYGVYIVLDRYGVIPGNPTGNDYGGGLLTVTSPTGACCVNGSTCNTGLTQTNCQNQGGVWQGANTTTCTNCSPPPTGACCVNGSTCNTGLTQTNCQNQGGVWQGANTTTCTNCSPPPTGACCVNGSTCNTGVTQGNCQNQGGVWQGANTTTCTNCSPTGACCINGNTCNTGVTQTNCQNQGGVWQGANTTTCTNCSPPPTGACCVNGSTCNSSVTQANCQNQGGVWQGANTTTCTNCSPPPTGACCINGSTCNTGVTQANCQNQSGVWQGASTTSCMNCTPTGACCINGNICNTGVTQLNCQSQGGVWQGSGTTICTSCSPIAMGACCLSNGGCLENLSQGQCQNQGGSYQGDSTSCSSTNYPQSSDDDYPPPYRNARCASFDSCQVDAWNFYDRQCTSFVAWRMNRDAGVTRLDLPVSQYPFSNQMGGRIDRLGNATDWADRLGQLGYRVDHTPAVGAIAHWTSAEIGGGFPGHVAYVRSVNPDGSVEVEEYNHTSCVYSRRPASNVGRFIHFGQSQYVGGSGGGSAGTDPPAGQVTSTESQVQQRPCTVEFCGTCLVPGSLMSVVGILGMKNSVRRRRTRWVGERLGANSPRRVE